MGALLKLLDNKPISGVFIKHSNLLIHQKGAASVARARVTLQNWYRKQLRTLGFQFIAQWEPKLGVTVKTLGIKVMKTKWGTCNPGAERIWLNLELAKKPLACIEYIVVHEMVLERKHNDTFIKIMNSKFPKWEYYREELNNKPLKNENWTY